MCSLPEKKAFATTCFVLKKDITADTESVDPSGSSDLTSQMEEIYSTWKSKNAIKNAGNKIHAPLLVKVIDIVSIIDDYVREQKGDSIARFTRHGAQVRDSKLTDKQIFYRNIIDLKNRVDHRIRTALNDDGFDSRNYLVKGLKKDPPMIGRGFDPSRVPSDSKIWSCAYCGCDSVNFVEEDDDCEADFDTFFTVAIPASAKRSKKGVTERDESSPLPFSSNSNNCACSSHAR